jgi:hypothetical protein
MNHQSLVQAASIVPPKELAFKFADPPLVGDEKREDFDKLLIAIAGAVNRRDRLAICSRYREFVLGNLSQGCRVHLPVNCETERQSSNSGALTRTGHIVVDFMKFSGGFIECVVRGSDFGEKQCNQS